ncbi:hypothetical protein ACOSQ2_004927 [Xanthoceras sorbifolium]
MGELSSNAVPFVALSFPSSASTYFDFGSILPQVENLLLPDDTTQLKEMGSTKVVNWGLSRVANVEAKKVASKCTTKALAVESENARLCTELELAKAKLKAKKAECNELVERCDSIAYDTVLQTKA